MGKPYKIPGHEPEVLRGASTLKVEIFGFSGFYAHFKAHFLPHRMVLEPSLYVENCVHDRSRKGGGWWGPFTKVKGDNSDQALFNVL